MTSIDRILERLGGRTGSPWWLLIGVTTAALALGLASAVGAYSLVARALRPVPSPPVLVTVVRGSMPQTMSATGTSYARSQARLSFSTAAATTGGVVQSVEVELGQQVSAGQPLVVLDSRAATRAVEQATATLESERIALTQAAAMAPSDVAAAAQGVSAASAALQRALNDRTTLRRGAGADAIAGASRRH
ncbi:MAG: biotin/lipoyl-binding protein [Dehalococcoidia bacterium]